MTKQSVDASGPFGAYLQRAATEHDPLLTHIERGTPCGEYMRRFWQPVALSKDLGDVPLAVTIMGEHLIVFRDGSGRIGLLERNCSHRNTSLEFGRIRERGIQCCYHGWHYDVDGTILDIPTEPTDSTLKHRLFHGAYPTHEFGGLVFAYMGLPDKKPTFPRYDFMEFPGEVLEPGRWKVPCNWLQVRENTQDPVHIVFLHTVFSRQQFGGWTSELPIIEYLQTPLGQMTSSTRRVDAKLHHRFSEMILPNIARIPDVGDLDRLAQQGRGFTTWIVPHDNTSCMTIGWVHMRADMTEAQRAAYWEMVTFGLVVDDRAYLERQREPADADTWISQGAISVHANEHLAASDGGVALYRRLVREGIEAIEAGEEPSGIVNQPGRPIRSFASNVIVPGGEPANDETAERARLRDCGRDMQQRVLAGEYRCELGGAE